MYQTELYHHGIKGQKWGIRRYQNPDGTLTEEGKKRYSDYKQEQMNRINKRFDKATEIYEEEQNKYYDYKNRIDSAIKYMNAQYELGRHAEYIKNMSFDDFIKEKSFIMNKKTA